MAYLNNQRHIAEAQSKLTLSQATRLTERNNQLKSLEYYYQAKQCIANRDIVGALRRFAREPTMLIYAVWRLRRIFFKRSDARSIERVAARSRQATRPAVTNMAA
jgi:hypothetical protein